MKPFEIARHIEKEISVGAGCVQLVSAAWPEPIDFIACGGEHHLQLTLLPMHKKSMGCFPDKWGSNRFEYFGKMFFVPAGVLIHTKSGVRRQKSIHCSIPPQALARWIGEEIYWTDHRLQCALDMHNSCIRDLILRVAAELRNPGFASELLVENSLAQIMIELSRHFRGIEDGSSIISLSQAHLRLIDERLAAPGDKPSLGELAWLCNMSVRQLTRAFRATHGKSVGEYIAIHRFERAKQLLIAGMPVKAVSHACGFTAPSNFTAAFVRATGQTPREFRNRITVKRIQVPTI